MAATKFKVYNFDFMGIANYCVAATAITFVLAIVIICIKGFNYGIDFSGGVEVQVKFAQALEAKDLRHFTESMGYRDAVIQSMGSDNEYLLRFEAPKAKTNKEKNDLQTAMMEKIKAALTTQFAKQGAEVRKMDSVGPEVGSSLKRDAMLAGFYALLFILIYIGLRFDYVYAPGAVICLFHDCIIILGIFSLLNREVNVQIMAALLTLIGYSLHDTIVNYDRIRENVEIYRDKPMVWIINRSVNDMLSRTVLSSFTTFLSDAAMYFCATGVIKEFAFAFGLGIIIGTFSSIYVASPLMLYLYNMQQKKKKQAIA